jgi:lysozyme
MNDKPLFDAIRAIKGSGLSQSDVVAVKQALAALGPVASVLPTPSSPDLPHFRIMAEHLELEEGRKPYAYQDHLGYWTIGIGRLIDKRKGGRLTDAEIDMLLANDIREKIAEIEDWPAWQAVKDNPCRATALLSMAFQMGANGLAGFQNSLRLVADKQWQAAAQNMLQSKWAKQTPARAKRVTQMLATGRAA